MGCQSGNDNITPDASPSAREGERRSIGDVQSPDREGNAPGEKDTPSVNPPEKTYKKSVSFRGLEYYYDEWGSLRMYFQAIDELGLPVTQLDLSRFSSMEDDKPMNPKEVSLFLSNNFISASIAELRFFLKIKDPILLKKVKVYIQNTLCTSAFKLPDNVTVLIGARGLRDKNLLAGPSWKNTRSLNLFCADMTTIQPTQNSSLEEALQEATSQALENMARIPKRWEGHDLKRQKFFGRRFPVVITDLPGSATSFAQKGFVVGVGRNINNAALRQQMQRHFWGVSSRDDFQKAMGSLLNARLAEIQKSYFFMEYTSPKTSAELRTYHIKYNGKTLFKNLFDPRNKKKFKMKASYLEGPRLVRKGQRIKLTFRTKAAIPPTDPVVWKSRNEKVIELVPNSSNSFEVTLIAKALGKAQVVVKQGSFAQYVVFRVFPRMERTLGGSPDGVNDNTMIMRDGEEFPGRIFFSRDGGNNWKFKEFFPKAEFPMKEFRRTFMTQDFIWVEYEKIDPPRKLSVLQISTDLGRTWSYRESPRPLSISKSTHIAFLNNRIYLADGLYSKDSGRTWQKFPLPPRPQEGSSEQIIYRAGTKLRMMRCSRIECLFYECTPGTFAWTKLLKSPGIPKWRKFVYGDKDVLLTNFPAILYKDNKSEWRWETRLPSPKNIVIDLPSRRWQVRSDGLWYQFRNCQDRKCKARGSSNYPNGKISIHFIKFPFPSFQPKLVPVVSWPTTMLDLIPEGLALYVTDTYVGVTGRRDMTRYYFP